MGECLPSSTNITSFSKPCFRELNSKWDGGRQTGKRETKMGLQLESDNRPRQDMVCHTTADQKPHPPWDFEKEGQLDESLAKLPSRRIQEAPLTLSGSVLLKHMRSHRRTKICLDLRQTLLWRKHFHWDIYTYYTGRSIRTDNALVLKLGFHFMLHNRYICFLYHMYPSDTF